MDAIVPLALGSVKALLLLVATGALVLAVRRRSARLRAVIWGTALAGSLVIPLVAPLVPTLSLPVPENIARMATVDREAPQAEMVTVAAAERELSTRLHISNETHAEAEALPLKIDWPLTLLVVWAVGSTLLLIRLGVGIFRVARVVRDARTVNDPEWHWHLERAQSLVGCRRRIRLLASGQVEVPATVGIIRPAIVLPPTADTWLEDRRQAVLLHELIHVARFDWPLRMIARVARAAYWFNPLVWWAVRRLDLEQELACDEEVLALGTRASSYACHLLGIARHMVPCPSPAIPALGMARKTHLEKRIMTILKKTTHRRAGLAVLIPAVILVAAMVPALAAVYPEDPTPRPASSELKQIMAEIEAAEERMEPHLKKIEDIEINMEPYLAQLEDIEIEIDEGRIAEIEAQMQPYLERIEEIEIDMEPFQEKMAELEEELQNLDLHIEDGTLREIERQISEQVEAHMEQFEAIQVEMEPFLEQIEAIHVEMEGFHEEMAKVHVDMEPIHAQIEDIHVDMEPFHEQMEEFERAMEPFHEEMEILGDRLEKALAIEVVAVLRNDLGAVVEPGAPLEEAAARITDDAHIHTDRDELRFEGNRSEARQILTDLLTPHRIGTQEAFDAAIDTAARNLSPLVIQID